MLSRFMEIAGLLLYHGCGVHSETALIGARHVYKGHHMPTDIGTALQEVLGWLAAAGILGYNGVNALRRMAKGISNDIPEFKEHRAHSEIVDHLRSEIDRMHEAQERMQERLDSLEDKQEHTQMLVGTLRADAILVYGVLAKVLPTEDTREHLLSAQMALLRMATDSNRGN